MVLPVQAALLLDGVLEGEALVRVELGIPAPVFANKPVLFDLLKNRASSLWLLHGD